MINSKDTQQVISMQKLFKDLWLRVMEDSKVNNHYTLLPSEAAKLVGDMFNVSAMTILMAVGHIGTAINEKTDERFMSKL